MGTAVISYVPYLYYFVEPVHSFVPSGSGYAAVVAFAGAVALIVVLLHREQRARNDAIGAHDSATATAAQMERLQRLAALLAAAVTPAQIARILVSEGTAAVGATAGWVSVLSDETDELEHLSSLGYAESFVEEHRLIPLEGLHVAAQVARTGQRAAPDDEQRGEDGVFVAPIRRPGPRRSLSCRCELRPTCRSASWRSAFQAHGSSLRPTEISCRPSRARPRRRSSDPGCSSRSARPDGSPPGSSL